MSKSRIYVGGIPPGTAAEELSGRFKSFGNVESVELAPDKVYPASAPGTGPIRFSRNFGFVSLVPKDEKSLQRAIGLYNGSSWRGCILRCKLAKPTMMAKIAEEKVEEENGAAEKVEYEIPPAQEGTKLRIKQPYKRELVTVVLGGSELKLEKLNGNAAPATAKAENVVELDMNAPALPRRTFEEHLREVAEKYAASEEGRRAAALAAEKAAASPPRSPRTAAREDQEAAVNLSMQRDEGKKGQAKKPAGAGGSGGRAVVPAKRPLEEEESEEEEILGSGSLPVFAMKRPASVALAPAKPAAPALQPRAAPQPRNRIVDFLSDDDVKMLSTRPVVDLSRFGSDSEDESAGGGIGGNKMKMIPQVDGAADSSDSDDSGSECESDSEQEKKGTSSSGEESRGDEESKDSTSSESGDSSSTSDDEESSEEGQPNGKTETQPTQTADHKEDENRALLNKVKSLLPAGAGFYRKTPLVQVEAAWRAGRETSIREFKERKRQALRQAGKGIGSGSGGRRRKE